MKNLILLLIIGFNAFIGAFNAHSVVLFEEGFYNDVSGVRIYKDADGNPFPGNSWNTKEGYFERLVSETTIKALLHSCRIDYTAERITVDGIETSKGRLQIGTGGGNLEFPYFGSISKISLCLSAGTEGDVATKALIQYKKTDDAEWKDLQLSGNITANAPIKWELENVSEEPMAIRILQDPAITKGNSLAVYDLLIEGEVSDYEPGPDPESPITLLDERFRDLSLYKVADDDTDPDRTKYYEELYFDRTVEGKTVRTKFFQGRIHNTQQPPADSKGATQGRALIDNFSLGGAMESPVFGSLTYINAKLSSGNGLPSKAVLQIKAPEATEWTDFASSEDALDNAITDWTLTNISSTPIAFRIIQDPSISDATLAIFNIRVDGTLYDGGTTTIDIVPTTYTEKTILSIEYYNVLGKRVSKEAKGFIIEQYIYEDGSTSSTKVFNQ